MLRSLLALFFLSFWLLPVQPHLSENADSKLSAGSQKLVKPPAPAVEEAIKPSQYRQAAPAEPISPKAAAPRDKTKRALPRYGDISERVTESAKIYRLNQAFLI